MQVKIWKENDSFFLLILLSQHGVLNNYCISENEGEISRQQNVSFKISKYQENCWKYLLWSDIDINNLWLLELNTFKKVKGFTSLKEMKFSWKNVLSVCFILWSTTLCYMDMLDIKRENFLNRIKIWIINACFV